jgi:hypothetical protein
MSPKLWEARAHDIPEVEDAVASTGIQAYGDGSLCDTLGLFAIEAKHRLVILMRSEIRLTRFVVGIL